MTEFNLPPTDLRTKITAGKTSVFDILRKKWVRMTPEEEVRQRFIGMLKEQMKYPISLMANEVEIKHNGNSMRADTVVYNKQGKPVAIIEFKAPSVQISNKTVDQIAIYNITFKVPYLILSNGITHFCLKVDFENRHFEPMNAFPTYSELCSQ